MTTTNESYTRKMYLVAYGCATREEEDFVHAYRVECWVQGTTMDAAISMANARVRAAGWHVDEPALVRQTWGPPEESMKARVEGCMRRVYFISFPHVVQEGEDSSHRLDCWVLASNFESAIFIARDRLRSLGWLVNEFISAREGYGGPYFKQAIHGHDDFALMIDGRQMIDGQLMKKPWWRFW